MKDSKKTGKINEINEDPFEEYIRLGEPDKADKAYAWQTAVGLQDVDRLQPSEYQKMACMRICLFWRHFLGISLWESITSLKTGTCI